jgi:hypothetical protein
MRIIIIISFMLLNLQVFSNDSGGKQQANRNGRYQNTADSLRKERLSPRTGDSVPSRRTENMPVLRGDSADTLSRMPKAEPDKNQHMPVKELSDTTHKK